MDDEELLALRGEQRLKNWSAFPDAELPCAERADEGLPLSEDLTESGSFDFREIKAALFGRLLQVLPIPSLLVDRSLSIIFVNRSLGRFLEDESSIVGHSFSSVFAKASHANKAGSLLQRMFLERNPMVVESMVQMGGKKMWARLRLRSIRLKEATFILVLVEDLTGKEKLPLLHQKYSRLLEDRKTAEKRFRSLEAQLTEFTKHLEDSRKEAEQYAADLKGANEALKVLIGGIDQQKKSVEKRIQANFSLSVKPILEQLKMEDLPSRVSSLIDSLASGIEKIAAPFGTRIMGEGYLLTLREMRICELISSGLTSKEIAKIMGVSPETIFFHRSNIRKKLGLTGTTDDLGTYLRKNI
jgi:DNA-binding CsgD family transcriptional regulator/F0F1-type ATP synthase membrane subunit b/b'